jgi:hypothetical protein
VHAAFGDDGVAGQQTLQELIWTRVTWTS